MDAHFTVSVLAAYYFAAQVASVGLIVLALISIRSDDVAAVVAVQAPA